MKDLRELMREQNVATQTNGEAVKDYDCYVTLGNRNGYPRHLRIRFKAGILEAIGLTYGSYVSIAMGENEILIKQCADKAGWKIQSPMHTKGSKRMISFYLPTCCPLKIDGPLHVADIIQRDESQHLIRIRLVRKQ